MGKIIVGISADPSVVGKAFYIEGGDAWEFEDTFLEYQPQWLGEYLVFDDGHVLLLTHCRGRVHQTYESQHRGCTKGKSTVISYRPFY